MLNDDLLLDNWFQEGIEFLVHSKELFLAVENTKVYDTFKEFALNEWKRVKSNKEGNKWKIKN